MKIKTSHEEEPVSTRQGNQLPSLAHGEYTSTPICYCCMATMVKALREALKALENLCEELEASMRRRSPSAARVVADLYASQAEAARCRVEDEIADLRGDLGG